MPLEIAKIVDEKELEGEELLQSLIDKTKKYEIKAIQDKRLIFTRVRTFLQKVFGSFYTTEKNEPMVLIAQALVRLKQNPHLKGRDEKMRQIRSLFDNLGDNGLLKLRHGQSEEIDYVVISQKLTVSINGESPKDYEIIRRIPSENKSTEEEQKRLVTYREELKVIEQARMTCKQVENLVSQSMEDEIKQQAAATVRGYFRSLEQMLGHAQGILTGNGYIEDDFIAELKLESLDLAEEMKDKSLIEKMIFLSSLNWYRHRWASNSFNEPDNLVYFLIGRMIFRHAPWNPKGRAEVREALETLEISCADLEQAFISKASGKGAEEESAGSIKVDRKKEKIIQLIKQLVSLNKMLASRKSVEQGNTLLKKFLRPGIRTEVSARNMEVIGQEIQSKVKMDCLGKMIVRSRKDDDVKRLVGWLRQTLGEGNMELFQQLQAFRVAHGLSNLADGKERERLSAFISPMDVVQFISGMAAGNINIKEATEDKVVFDALGSTGEKLDTGKRTLTNKGLSYDEAAKLINKEFENLLINYEKPDFEARCSESNPGYSREEDHHVKIKNFAWVCRRFPFLKMYFGAGALLISPIMHNIMLGEEEKEEKTIHQKTAEFMGKVIELERHLIEIIEQATKKLKVSEVDKNRLESQMVSGTSREGEDSPQGGGGDGNYSLLLEEGIQEIFPKLNFELQVIAEQSGGGDDDGGGSDDGRTLTEEERAFEEKYGHMMEDSPAGGGAEQEAPAKKSMVSPRTVNRLARSLENLSIFYEALKAQGYEKRIPVMRRDQIVSNIRDACYYIKDILKNLDPEESDDAAELLRKTENLLNKTRDSIQRTEVIEEKVDVEEENVEVPLYEIHSILVTLNSSYMVSLGGLLDLIGQKHKTNRGSLIKDDQINATKKLHKHIESAISTLIKNSREIKLESPRISMGLRDVMSMNINAAIGEINRLKRSQLIIQSCQHPNDLNVYLNQIARVMLEKKLMVPLHNIQTTLKKTPTFMDEKQYAVWKAEGEENMTASIFGRMDVPSYGINDLPRVLRSVISVSDQLADHLVARGHELRQKMSAQNQTPPEKTNFDQYADRMTKKVSGSLGQLHAFFIPDTENNITFDADHLEDILRVVGTCVGELIELSREFNKNKAAFQTEIEAIRKIVPVLEGLRNTVNDYNTNYLKQKKSADLARSQTNCDKTLIAYCQELQKYDDPTTVEYKTLIIRGRVYLALENQVQKILGNMKSEFNPDRKKKTQVLVNEVFYMMSHVKMETRDLPLFKKFRQSALRAAKELPDASMREEVLKLLDKGEEVQDWIRVAESNFEEGVINQVYTPGMDLERLRKLGESI